MSEIPEQKTEEPPKPPLNSSEPTATPATKKKFWNADKLLSLMAFLISLGTFTVFAYQTYLIRKQQYASVMPYLALRVMEARNGNQLSTAQLILKNDGVGPAFIRDIRIVYRDSAYTLDPAAFYRSLVSPDSTSISTQTIEIGHVIPAGQEITLINAPSEYTASLLNEIAKSAALEITYTSVYDEAWQINSSSPIPQKLP
jgi:hypothetical protein